MVSASRIFSGKTHWARQASPALPSHHHSFSTSRRNSFRRSASECRHRRSASCTALESSVGRDAGGHTASPPSSVSWLVPEDDAERRGRHSHAERGNECQPALTQRACRNTPVHAHPGRRLPGRARSRKMSIFPTWRRPRCTLFGCSGRVRTAPASRKGSAWHTGPWRFALVRRNPAVGLDRRHGVEGRRALVLPDEPGSGPDAALASGGDADLPEIPQSRAERVDLRPDRSAREHANLDGARDRLAEYGRLDRVCGGGSGVSSAWGARALALGAGAASRQPVRDPDVAENLAPVALDALLALALGKSSPS